MWTTEVYLFIGLAFMVAGLIKGAVGVGFPIISPGNHEYWVTPVIGVVNGTVTGLTGTFVVPGVLYLQSLGLTRDVLVQEMGILFLVSTTALGVGLSGHNLLNTSYLLISALAVAPAFAGMALGRRMRRSNPEKRFARVFFCSLFLLGIYIISNCFF